MFNQASTQVKVAMGLICANWAICFALGWIVGGTAFYGEIAGGEFIVRRGTTSPGVVVSPGFWGFSLFYTVLTVGGSFLALALLHVFHRPRRDRGLGDVILVAASALLSLFVLGYSAPRIAAWAAV